MIPTLIKTQNPSGAGEVDFVDGASSVVLDSTYDHYMFVFTDITPATDNADFVFQVNATDDAGGGFDTSLITSTNFSARHNEADDTPGFNYVTGDDLAQAADFQYISRELYISGANSDTCLAGIMHLFNPASTAYVKPFYIRTSTLVVTRASDTYVSGYINDTTAIDEIRFKMDNGNMSGTIQLYGIA